MPDKPKPLTRAEWDAIDLNDADRVQPALVATIAALFEYRERTRAVWFGTVPESTDDIAADLGVE